MIKKLMQQVMILASDYKFGDLKTDAVRCTPIHLLFRMQSTIREPAKKNMYKGVSYSIIIASYWTLAFSGYWAFGSQVQPYILSSLTVPGWTIVMANLFAVIQISGCFQIYSRPTYALFEESVHWQQNGYKTWFWRLVYTLIYITIITLISAAMPFFGDFVAICGAIGFTPLDFVFPALAFLMAGKMPKNHSISLLVRVANIFIAALFSLVAMLGCVGAVRSIVLDVKTYKFFHDMCYKFL